MHDDRLKDTALPYVLGEFVEPSFRELGARVAGVFVQAVDGDEECVADSDIECRRVA